MKKPALTVIVMFLVGSGMCPVTLAVRGHQQELLRRLPVQIHPYRRLGGARMTWRIRE